MDNRTKKKIEELDRRTEEYFIQDLMTISNDFLCVLVKPRIPYFYDSLNEDADKE